MQNVHSGEFLPLAGYPVLSTSYEGLCAVLHERLRSSVKTALVFANTNFVLQCKPMRPWLNDDSVIVVNDGVGMDIASLLNYGRRFAANLNGTDFTPHLLKTMAEPHRLFLLGGRAGVAAKAGVAITALSGQAVVGTCDGYSAVASSQLCERINASGADIVLVAMGNPIQEAWIQQHMAELDATLFISVGALFDFMSGGVPRAPRWMQKARLEWFFRLCQEPRRMVRRYTVDIAEFLVLCVSYPWIHRGDSVQARANWDGAGTR